MKMKLVGKDIHDILKEKCVGKDIHDVEEILKEKFDEVRIVDIKIDDKCNEGEEDDYVMMRSYNVSKYGAVWYMRFYYGNNTRKVGYWTYDRED